MSYTCTVCQKEVNPEMFTRKQWRSKMSLFRKTGRIYCSTVCSKQFTAQNSAKVMAETNRKYASARMKANNPMKKPETRQKVSERLKEIGHCPKVRCGNGAGLTVPQQNLLLALKDLEPYAEYPVPVRMPLEGLNYPTCYKVDVAIPSFMVAIEVDGRSHCALSRKEQDAKKAALLERQGWTVLRFWNRQVTEHLEDCVQMVLSTISKLRGTTTTL